VLLNSKRAGEGWNRDTATHVRCTVACGGKLLCVVLCHRLYLLVVLPFSSLGPPFLTFKEPVSRGLLDLGPRFWVWYVVGSDGNGIRDTHPPGLPESTDLVYICALSTDPGRHGGMARGRREAVGEIGCVQGDDAIRRTARIR
jgi:hypothetical protein